MKRTVAVGSFVLASLSACGGGAPNNPPEAPKPATSATETPTGSTVQAAPTPAASEAPATPPAPDNGGFSLIAPSSVKYQPSSPDKPGPEIAVLHGDPKSGGAFLLRFPPGAKSGLHTHTSDYEAVVVSGAPKHWLAGAEAKAKPLASGSYWFQPGGQPHGDECTGKDPCVLFVIMPGALDFTPAPKATAGPVGKYTLTARKDAKFAPMDPTKPAGPKIAVIFGDPKTGPVALILETPGGSNVGLHRHTNDYQALVLDGAPAHWLPDQAHEGEALAPATYWFQPGGYDHGDRCSSTTPCHLFVFLDKGLDFLPAKTVKK
jgi:quercetin dioxygenase-like cupin family protein